MKEQLIELLKQMNKEVEQREIEIRRFDKNTLAEAYLDGGLKQLLYDIKRIQAICASNGM